MKIKMVVMLAAVSVAVSTKAACPYANGGKSSSGSTCNAGTSQRTIIIGGCRRFWDVYPRAELNPPDDIATLPEREQLRFVKIFRLVPEQVKVKSTQNYAGRMLFMQSPQYAAITNKLATKLARSAKMLAADPEITAEMVQKMCSDTLVYGRSLVMGHMEMTTFTDLARQYRFKNAAKVVENLEDSKNFKRGLVAGYPHGDPECRDFEMLAKTVNPAQWQAFLARIETLRARRGDPRKAASQQAAITKKQLYDRYDETSRRTLPDDMATLPNRMQVRESKIYDFLPVQVLSAAGQEYAQRRAYFASGKYAEVRQSLGNRLVKDARRMAADPAITSADVLKTCDELVKYGRPLVCGDMRHVSLTELAHTYRFMSVEKFIETVEDEKYVKRGLAMSYPRANPEFADFAVLAKRACLDRWNAFLSRLAEPNRGVPRKNAGR